MRMSVQKFKMLHNPSLVANVKLRTSDVIGIIIMIWNSGCHLTLYQSIIYVIVDQLQELQPLFSIKNQTKPKEDWAMPWWRSGIVNRAGLLQPTPSPGLKVLDSSIYSTADVHPMKSKSNVCFQNGSQKDNNLTLSPDSYSNARR